jgi:hypothetical protein
MHQDLEDLQMVSKASLAIKAYYGDKSISFKDREFKNEIISNRRLESLNIINARVNDCIFENLDINELLTGGGKTESFLENCRFINSKFNFLGGFATLINCSFENVTIGEMFALRMQFINCKFSGKLKKVVFNARVPKSYRVLVGRDKNIFEGNDLSEAFFDDVGFRGGIDFTKQKMPKTDDYVYIYDPEIIKRAKNRLLEVKNKNYTEDLLSWINGMEYDMERGQKHFFIKLSDFTKIQNEKNEIRELFQAK